MWLIEIQKYFVRVCRHFAEHVSDFIIFYFSFPCFHSYTYGAEVRLNTTFQLFNGQMNVK